MNLTQTSNVKIPGERFPQSLNITILDDNIVEDREFINLRLTTQTPEFVSVNQAIARVEISDNDGILVCATIQCWNANNNCDRLQQMLYSTLSERFTHFLKELLEVFVSSLQTMSA